MLRRGGRRGLATLFHHRRREVAASGFAAGERIS